MSADHIEREKVIELIDERLEIWQNTQLSWQLTHTTVCMLESLRRDVAGREARRVGHWLPKSNVLKFILGNRIF